MAVIARELVKHEKILNLKLKHANINKHAKKTIAKVIKEYSKINPFLFKIIFFILSLPF